MSDVFRKKYTPLSEEQKMQVEAVKTQAEELWSVFEKAIPQEERSSRSRYMALARTALEESIMWAVKGITE